MAKNIKQGSSMPVRGIAMYLNIEQKKLIQSSPNGPNIIKGVAGSGKTTVAVHRISFLLSNYCYGEDDRVLFVTYNKTLMKYVEHLYSKVDDENMYDNLFGCSSDKVDICTLDSILYRYYSEYKKANNFRYNVTFDQRVFYEVLNASIVQLKKEHTDVKILDQKYMKFLLDEISWIKACNYMEMEEY